VARFISGLFPDVPKITSDWSIGETESEELSDQIDRFDPLWTGVDSEIQTLAAGLS
jgi:hypothetical protein